MGNQNKMFCRNLKDDLKRLKRNNLIISRFMPTLQSIETRQE